MSVGHTSRSGPGTKNHSGPPWVQVGATIPRTVRATGEAGPVRAGPATTGVCVCVFVCMCGELNAPGTMAGPQWPQIFQSVNGPVRD